MIKYRKVSGKKARASNDTKRFAKDIGPADSWYNYDAAFMTRFGHAEKNIDTLHLWPRTACIGGAREGKGSFRVVWVSAAGHEAVLTGLPGVCVCGGCAGKRAS